MEHWKLLLASLVGWQETFLIFRRSRMTKTVMFLFISFCSAKKWRGVTLCPLAKNFRKNLENLSLLLSSMWRKSLSWNFQLTSYYSWPSHPPVSRNIIVAGSWILPSVFLDLIDCCVNIKRVVLVPFWRANNDHIYFRIFLVKVCKI